MNWDYVSLCVMNFLEFAVWGAWAPVLASHLLGPMKMNGKQVGWIYATIWLGCIISPFLGGQLADRYLPAEQALAGAHLIGGVLLLLAAHRKKFWGLFWLMMLYALFYAPTLSLSYVVMFNNLPAGAQEGRVRVWGTIGWIVAGLGLALWRRMANSSSADTLEPPPGSDAGQPEPPKGRPSDSLLLAGVLSLIMGAFCFTLPSTPPPPVPGDPLAFMEAFSLLKDSNFLIFLIISFVVSTELQFYYVPTAPFLEDLGVKRENTSAVMTLAQFAEIIAMAFLLTWSVDNLGMRWTLVIGVVAWPLRYVIFAMLKPLWLIKASLTCHGLGYTFFIFAGTIYVNRIAPEGIKASAQALILVATLGLGNFLGTQVTGVVMDHFRTEEGKFRWRPIFLFPCVLTILCAIAFILFFKDTSAAAAVVPGAAG
jgi:nucleoside transporter